MMQSKALPPAARDVISDTPNGNSDQCLRSFSALDKTDARYVREYNNTTLATTQGKVVIDDLDVPEDVKQLLFDLDFDYSGEVSKEELKDMCTHLMQLHAELGEGASNAKINELLELIIRQVNRKKNNASFMEYSHLPAKLQKCFQVWDVDKDGRVDANELMAAADAWQKLQKESALMKKLLLAACIVVVLMFAGMFAMGLVTAEMAKEFKAGGSGDNPRMTSKSGDTIQVASSDTQTDGSGVLLTRAVLPNNTTGRNLLGSGAASVATQDAKTKSRLVSTLPDSFFDALNEINVYSEKGHTLNLKIQGYARIPLKNSRCGNVLKMYTSVDGAIVLDSDVMSFEDKLDTLFKNAGFEVAVGGAAGRRLANSASVDGFFSHVSKMESEGSWKCGDIPLPHMPTHHIKKFDSYVPCIELGSTTQMMSSCDSLFGGKMVGTTKLPTEHASATLSRLDQVQDTLSNGKVQDPTADKLYKKTNQFSIVSPGYTVQRTSYELHPAQELIRVTDLSQKKFVSFQQMHSEPDEPAIRNFCKNPGGVDPVLKEKESHKDSAQDTSVHFEYVGLESEGAKTYRRFRLLPSKDFSAWMGSEGVGKIPSTVYHYWDDADSDSFTPYRLVTPGGDIVVYTEMRQITTDEEAEVFLKSTINSTKFGIFTKPYKMDCDETEKGPSSPEFGTVPAIDSGELTIDAINFYSMYLYDAGSDGEVQNGGGSGDAASLSQAVRGGNDTKTLLASAFTYLQTVTEKSRFYGFAQHALLAHGKLSMASVCSTPCAAERNAVQGHMTGNGKWRSMCSAPELQSLVKCIGKLGSEIRVYCLQSIFWATYEAECLVVLPQEASQNRRLQYGQAEMHQLPDGTHSLDLGSLDQQTKMHLSGAISASQKDASSGDLNGYVLLFNASNIGKHMRNSLLSGGETDASADSSARSHVSRRLAVNLEGGLDELHAALMASMPEWCCTKLATPGFCIQFRFKPGADFWQCWNACKGPAPFFWPKMSEQACKDATQTFCKWSFKVKVAPPYWIPKQLDTMHDVDMTPSCQMQEGNVWAFCGTTPVAQWVVGPEGETLALGSCQYAYFEGEMKDYCAANLEAKQSNMYKGTWTVSVELAGKIDLLKYMFPAIALTTPLEIRVDVSGGIMFQNAAACPDIPFTLEGWAMIALVGAINVGKLGVTVPGLKTIDALSISLKVGAKITGGNAMSWQERTDRRRGWDWRRRRGLVAL